MHSAKEAKGLNTNLNSPSTADDSTFLVRSVCSPTITPDSTPKIFLVPGFWSMESSAADMTKAIQAQTYNNTTSKNDSTSIQQWCLKITCGSTQTGVDRLHKTATLGDLDSDIPKGS
eukprot:753954-Hanusia_phi.AAC.5